ncbi:hypothetical protein [Paraburkholderia kururiensis]|jgi:hypothetical protein|uniref:hypothetical protein n=1 Tax=Paraburkholderia kururiensis TaxID=984307 RepID=UPI001F20A5BA|nr:hypothetical protein [Paraburkholderia kururiensis]
MRSDLPADLADIAQRPPIYRLLGVAEKVRGRHLNHVWKGLAGVPWFDEPGIPVFAKYLPKSVQLDIEFACGLASQVLQLPVPKPALVLAELEDLPDHPAALTQSPVVLFGSLFQPPDPFLARLVGDDPLGVEYIWQKVCGDAVAPKGAAWDELVANPDRHAQNLLFDGGKWWLFDHNLALQPLSALYASIEQDSATRKIVDHVARVNQLLSQMRNRHPNDQGVLAEADKLLRQSRKLTLLAIEMRKWDELPPQVEQTVRTAAVIVDLIALRLKPLAMYIEQRLDMPSAETLWSRS